ncbi:MAG: hypothetical protein K1X78_10995 [Verrucomicrobiaceae bacterium]|nr:hypothetical protein [Verrucomicrobiaceae bacterium]
MNDPHTRRRFLAEVGKGTLLSTIGPALASELGIMPAAFAADRPEPLDFGDMEPLVRLMQETEVAKLQPALLARLKSGVPLKKLLAAGALANARTFGGEDYVGFHTLMALTPAMRMSDAMPSGEQALPVFKVLYRNSNRIQEHGGRTGEVLHAVGATPGGATDAALHAAVKRKDEAAAEGIFAALVKQDTDAAFAALLHCVQDDTEVHRTVLPYRAWDLLDVVGHEHALTLLRQSLRYCLAAEGRRRPEWDEHSDVLARLLDEHKLLDREPGTRAADDGFIEKLSQTIFNGTPAQAAGAVAAALAVGFDPLEVGEAVSLAANQLLLHDLGRPPAWEAPGKPAGSVHGDSIGVHACDSANAWRNLSRVSRGAHVHACLILGAWQMARDTGSRPDIRKWDTVPSGQQLNAIAETDAPSLLAALDDAIRGNMQGRASAVAQRCGERGVPAEKVFATLLRYAVSEDGALHAEKYYQTVCDEFRTTRPAFRWRHVTALARVTASEYGRPAPGQAEARELLRT